MQKNLLGLLLIGVSMTAFATLPPAPAKPMKPIVVTQPSPTVTFMLPANPTTGYSWFLKSEDSNLIAAVSEKFEAPKTNRPGAGGMDVWTFRVKSPAFVVPRVTTIVMEYARPWDLADATLRTVDVVIRPGDK